MEAVLARILTLEEKYQLADIVLLDRMSIILVETILCIIFLHPHIFIENPGGGQK